MRTFTPSVSIVINTLNRADHLNDALLSLKGLDYPEFEVVVVNGPSTDATAQIIERWGSGIKSLTCPEPNLSMSRNIGIAAAAGDVICFIDDDAAPHPKWLRHLTLAYHNPAVGGVGGFTIDNTGVRWQVRKTLCDRYGNAHNVSQYFDERPLNRPGTPIYPSLLGTNSSFRAEALREIGGFDEAFAYLLDETDVCLRIVDAGWHVQYEPKALIYHQFAESHIRSSNRIARTLYPSARSKAYFIMTHGFDHDSQRAGLELERYKNEIVAANSWHEKHRDISSRHRHSLDEDLFRGMDEGLRLARQKESKNGDLDLGAITPFRKFETDETRLRIAFVSRGFPPSNESGIARWTWMAATALAARGHHVHVLTESQTESEAVNFSQGVWLHELHVNDVVGERFAERYDVPTSLMGWSGRVWQEVQYLKSFGLDIASFPIWDLEGVSLLDEHDITTVVSLHTTYLMAKPFKPEWSIRPLFEHHFINRVIAAERYVFTNAQLLLANSSAIIDEIEDLYDTSIREHSPIVPHGTPDPLIERASRHAARNELMRKGAPLRVLYVGRFEQRKGFDIALRVASALIKSDQLEFIFIGDALDEQHQNTIVSLGADNLLLNPQVSFLGKVDRTALNDAFVDADLVIMPSRFESFGLVAIEAMAAGRPVIALSAGGLAEVATTENGCTTFAENASIVQAIASEVNRLHLDRNLLAKRGLLARQAYERQYTLDAMAQGLEQAYKQALNSGQPQAVNQEGKLIVVD